MIILPLNDRILLKKDEAKEQTDGGIYIPPNSIETQAIATVVNIGKAVDNDIKTGDKVFYKEYSAVDITVDGEEYMVIKQEDIIALLVESK